jgi:RNA polymerase sigma factor (sigma-70 family)
MMNYVISDIGTPRKKYPAELGHKNTDQKKAIERFLPLYKYHELARRIIGKFAPASYKTSMLASEDAIDFVAHFIMRGDWGYEQERDVKIETWRGIHGKQGVLLYIKAVSRHRRDQALELVTGDDQGNQDEEVSTDPKAIEAQTAHINREIEQETRDLITGLLNALAPVQRACISLHYLDGVSHANVAKQLNITREGVRKSIKEGIKKLTLLATEMNHE